MRAELDGGAIEFWRVVPVAAGSVLKLGAIDDGGGQRSYLALSGGFDVPRYMGSRATFVLGQFGGHAGRALRTGDVLRFGATRVHGWRRPRSARGREPAGGPATAIRP